MTATTSGLVLTSEHEDLRRSLRSFLQTAASEAEVRRVMETGPGVDDATWQRLAHELGVTGLLVPEEHGGAGYGFGEIGVVLEEAGRSLLVAPLLSTVLATAAVLRSGDAAAAERWLPGIASGDLRATVALPVLGLPAQSVSAAADERLTGELDYVLDGATADLLLVPATSPTGAVGLYAIEASAAGLTRAPLQTVDLTRRLARITLSGVPATLLAGDATDVLTHVRSAAAVALAVESVGAAQRVLEMTVEYAKVRNQFGRAIGSFQAVKHRCADMLVDVESARSAAYFALSALASDGDDLLTAAAMAKAFCCDAFLACATASIQLHGGIGFTWEHSAHLYLKRAKASHLLFGDSAHHRQELAELQGW